MAAKSQLKSFLASRIESYDQDRNTPDLQGSTALSAHLHFGHISPHYVFWSLMEQQGWNPSLLSKPNGKNSGFWGVSPSAEALLDQLCTWREIGFNMCWREANYDQYDSLPDWARSTLAKHAGDPRPNLYSLEQMELAKTHDPIWNAAQRQLVREGRIHNYLRMLWGKKILQWSPTPQTALQSLIHLNNKYALDGRDPNSYSGIFWCLGRYDRAWGPERPIFGSVRYMTSENTAKKHSLKQYLQRFSSTD
jgi:deoxyribodipyrimidine photo-lyase